MSIDIKSLQYPYRGNFSLGTYSKGDRVTYNGSAWLSTEDQNTDVPSNTSAKWIQLTQGASVSDISVIDLYVDQESETALDLHRRCIALPRDTLSFGHDVMHYLMANGEVKSCGYGDNFGNVGAGDTATRYHPNRIHVTDDARFIKIIKGWSGGFGLTKEGYCYTWGANISGYFGDGGLDNKINATRNEYFFNNNIFIKDVVLSRPRSGLEMASFFITDDGDLFSCGANENKILGDGGSSNISTPTPILIGKKIIGVSVDAVDKTGVLAWSANGDLYVWGRNLNGCLGIGWETIIGAPTLHPYITDVKEAIIIAGSNNAQTASEAFSVVLTNNGEVYTIGANSFGQLGTGDNEFADRFKKITNFGDSNTFVVPPVIDKIYAGGGYYGFVIALTPEGNCWSWGFNTRGHLGNETTQNILSPFDYSSYYGGRAIKQVVIAGHRSAATLYLLGYDGAVYASGFGSYGQIGRGDAVLQNPTSLPMFLPIGEVAEIGAHSRGLPGVTEHAISFSICVVRFKDGRVFTCGDARAVGVLGSKISTNTDPLLTLSEVRF
jgi:alpha-tubulin suppressor-like RCC1 family protein